MSFWKRHEYSYFLISLKSLSHQIIFQIPLLECPWVSLCRASDISRPLWSSSSVLSSFTAPSSGCCCCCCSSCPLRWRLRPLPTARLLQGRSASFHSSTRVINTPLAHGTGHLMTMEINESGVEQVKRSIDMTLTPGATAEENATNQVGYISPFTFWSRHYSPAYDFFSHIGLWELGYRVVIPNMPLARVDYDLWSSPVGRMQILLPTYCSSRMVEHHKTQSTHPGCMIGIATL